MVNNGNLYQNYFNDEKFMSFSSLTVLQIISNACIILSSEMKKEEDSK